MGGYYFNNTRLNYQLGPQRGISGRMRFQFGSFYDGTRQEMAYSGRVEISPQLSFEPNIAVNRVHLLEGDFTATLVGTRATYNFSPRMSFSALVQYSSVDNEFLTNLRYRWEYTPGSDFFVVYNDGRATNFDRPLYLQSRSFAVKFTRLFRF